MPPKIPNRSKKKSGIRFECFEVPFTQVEWTVVCNLFKSNDPKHLDLCLNLLAMWKTRMGKEAPLAVDISQMLIQARHSEIDRKGKWFAEGNIRMIYASAIIRFINYVHEIGLKKHYNYASIYDSLRPFGIPRWIVGIRHDCAHKFMPSTATLRKAVEFCRAWLWKFYWSKPIEESVQWKQLSLNTTAESNTLEDLQKLESNDSSSIGSGDPEEVDEEPATKKHRNEAEDGEIVCLSPTKETTAKEDDGGWVIASDWNTACPLGLTPHQTSESLTLTFVRDTNGEPIPLSLDMYPDVIDDCSAQFPEIVINTGESQ
ncbi:hypothetical protein L596_007073 [Steinernema carpocapsae]|uniref:Uncharacterized protein n=1 Tax=Steinernema carpocapsae TaxID=34508 RepID=A0A4U5P869_STECR|nr:hypothetical protein L596_007073 [Steinernema carpocapsae]